MNMPGPYRPNAVATPRFIVTDRRAHAQASIVDSRESVSIGKKSAANRRLRRHSNAGELRGESSWTANEPEKK